MAHEYNYGGQVFFFFFSKKKKKKKKKKLRAKIDNLLGWDWLVCLGV